MSKKTLKPKPDVKQPIKDLRITGASKRPFAKKAAAKKAAAKKVAPSKKASSAK
jgi:hypothetical protein